MTTTRLPPGPRRRAAVALGAAVAGVVLLAGCGVAAQSAAPWPTTTVSGAAPAPSALAQSAPPAPSTSPAVPPSSSSALTQLAALPVKGRAPKTGYARSQFGQAWADVDHNGCDTRNDILKRDLSPSAVKPGTHGCVIASVTLADPYTAKTIAFTRGPGTSSAVQIDHVVALGDAWQKGAQQLSPARRTALANDPQNLLAVDGPANAQKGDGDAATWLPANVSYRCSYVARQISVKAAYGLWVTRAEHDAMAGVLARCTGAG